MINEHRYITQKRKTFVIYHKRNKMIGLYMMWADARLIEYQRGDVLLDAL